MKIDGVIFDLDGTLLNSRELRIDAWLNAFADFGIKVSREEIGPLLGLPGVDLAGLYSSRAFEIEEAEERYFRSHISELKFYPDVEATIDAIKKSGIKTSIVTSSRRSFVDIMGIHFSPVVTIDDVTVGKPDPEGYMKAIGIMGLSDPHRVMVVGDAISDMRPANDVGAISVFIRHGSDTECTICNYYIDEVSECLRVISEIEKVGNSKGNKT